MATDIKEIIKSTREYNLHSHSQFCDGHDTMEAIANSAAEAGMLHFAFTPHSPVCIDSPCNMKREDMDAYFSEIDRLRDIHQPGMEILRSLEIDFFGADFGPHIDYFQRLDLDFRLGSVHFVPNQEGVLLDCDGSVDRFKRYLKEGYEGDLRYVVEKYFEQVLLMIERGGFDLLGHFDKIAGNASAVDPTIEEQGWYKALVADVIGKAKDSGVVVEINTKAYADRGRFYPDVRWWPSLIASGAPIAVDSDAHYASKVTASRAEAFRQLDAVGFN